MKDEHPNHEQLSTEERLLIQQLRERPELMERFKHILEIAADAEGPIKTADEVEAPVIDEMRRLVGDERARDVWRNLSFPGARNSE